jgi:hypothetical protein
MGVRLVSENAMPPRTRFLGRLIGLYCILIPLSMAVHKHSAMDTVTALMHNPPLVFLVSFIGVVSGLALVIGHNVWSGGALPVIVTVVGWTTLIKSLLLLFLSPETSSGFFLGGLQYEQWFYFYAGFSFLLGICMTFMSVGGKERGAA